LFKFEGLTSKSDSHRYSHKWAKTWCMRRNVAEQQLR